MPLSIGQSMISKNQAHLSGRPGQVRFYKERFIMRFYKPLVNKKTDIAGFIICFILIAFLTECGHKEEAPAVTDNSSEHTTEYTEPSEEPVPTQVPEATAEPALAETPAPTEQPAETEEPATEADGPNFTFINGVLVSVTKTDSKPEQQDSPADNDRTENAETGRTSATIPDIDEITDTTIAASGGYKAFCFRTDGYIGAVLDMEHFNELQYELYYGLHVTTDGSVVNYTAYDHTEDGVTPVKTWITFEETGRSAIVDTASCDQAVSFDLKNQDNGLYSLHTTFDNGIELVLPLYRNAGQAYIVQAVLDTASDKAILNAITKPERIRELAESCNVTPEKSLSVDPVDIAYPIYPYEGKNDRCDTELWAALAHEIVPDETLSESVKVVMLHDWMTQNLAYDTYRVQVCEVSRAKYYSDYTGTWNVYNTHTGVCGDFVNIFAIMCRELNIPCGSIRNEEMEHTWNIVWLDGQWQEVDFTYDIKRHTYKEDVTDVSGSTSFFYEGFLPLTAIDGLNEAGDVNWNLHCANWRHDGYCHDCIHTR